MNIKHILFALVFLFVHSKGPLAQGISSPRTPSPAATVSQTIGISTVTVKYSRPAVRGREVWGSLVPYGWNKQNFGNGNEAPWRAGANENTVIELSHAAQIEGKLVPAGSYSLFFIVNNDNTGELILSKDFRSWGSFFYEPKNDMMRAKIKLRTIPNEEMLTYEFGNLSKNAAELYLNWEKKQFPVRIEFDVDQIVMDNATEELKGPLGFDWQGYLSAVNYAMENKTHYEQALGWIDQAIAQNKTYTTLRTKAGLLRRLNRNAEAESLMNEALPIATENEMNSYGYQLLNQKEFDKAIEVFKLNTVSHPSSANAFDSLGEAYFTKGDKKNAIANFKKSLSLNPTDGTKANSEKFLKQLGAL